MPEYVCPNCRGGFPKQRLPAKEQHKCPWCHQVIDGSYEPPTVHSVSKVESTDEPEPPHGVLGRLFGWEPDDD